MIFLASDIADMHTHSESSHDSVCRIEDMRASQLERGTRIFAVTDHLDTASFMDYDVFTPISRACERVDSLNAKHKDSLILKGVEISEGFWYPEQCKKALELEDYDVVIGSVHLVRYKELTYAYSKIDFSQLDTDTVHGYLDAYFDDVITMLETVDFDILAHLTCPMRYIIGKYGVEVDTSLYCDKIDRILTMTLEKGISLEVNTSSYLPLGTCMPDEDILRRYYAMGGRLMTLGSDAHIAEHASGNFDRALALVKEVGFDGIYIYQKRKPIKLSI